MDRGATKVAVTVNPMTNKLITNHSSIMNMTTQKFRALSRAAAVSMLSLSAVFGAYAATITVDGITYTVKTGNKLEVAKGTNPAYSGDLVIPATVENAGTTYTVATIASTAFKANADITSVTLPDGIATTPRGCFQNCTALKWVRLPQDVTKMNQDAFSGCTALEEISIPASLTSLPANTFQNCTALAKMTFETANTSIAVGVNIWGTTKASERALKELYINREITTEGATGPAALPFTGTTTLEKVVYGNDALTSVPDYCYQNCSAMASVTLPAGLTSLGSQSFLNTGLTSVTIPDGVTSIASSTFNGCKSLATVTLGDNVTTIGDMAFYNAGVKTINMPSALTKIGAYAFSGASIDGALQLPAALTTIGTQAFAKNKSITSVSLQGAVSSIGSAAFMNCSKIASFSVDAANTSFKVLASGALASADGKMIYSYPAASTPTTFADATATEIDAYAFYGAKNLTEISLPACTAYGDYSLAGTGITKISVSGTIGRYLLSNCKSLQEVTVAGKEVPLGICKGCESLTKYNRTDDITIVRQEAFSGCKALTDLDLGKLLVIIEADAFADINPMNLTVAAHTPAALGVGVFTSATPITVTVPESLVATYKAAAGWMYLTIKGDANLAEGGTDMGMPAGLYYAGTDGNIHCYYADGNTDTYDVGGMEHTFQMIQFKNRIYGASAGKKFYYSSTSASEGDGVLFYVSRVDGNVFQATVLDNTGNNAYKDPFGLYIYGDTLYVNDRNVCIRKIAADAIALPQSYESWMENNWMAYYGAPWTYGCIKAGFAITKDKNANGEDEPLYWVAMKYNGEGIFRFKEEHIGNASAAGASTGYTPMLTSSAPVMSTFYIDEANGHLYAYIQTANRGNEKQLGGGVYRFNLADLEATPDPAILADSKIQLIDGAPVYWEGSGTEQVGISQFSPDENGEYLYWCYRAPKAADITNVENGTDNHWAWAETYSAENPLHQTGIKRIKLGEANPTVEVIASGAEGYGLVPVNFEGSVKPSGIDNTVVNEKAAYDRVLVAGNSFTLTDAAAVNVYAANGALVLNQKVAADATVTLDNNAGVYVVEAIFADGAKQVVKVAVK